VEEIITLHATHCVELTGYDDTKGEKPPIGELRVLKSIRIFVAEK